MEIYANNTPATEAVYLGSIPSLMLGILSTTTEIISTWAILSTGEVISAEWIATSSQPVGRLYSTSTGLCWQAPYSSTSGYGTWVQTSTGPLGTSCTTVTSAAWYTRAQALSGGATSMTAESVSSGYIGLTYMVHESTSNAVFGGELDGRTLRSHLNKGKPVEGEIYVVATGSSGETLLTSTEASVQAQLNSTTAVDPASVGGLTGSSASTLQTTLNTFTNLWLRSTTVSMADTYGQVSSRCPSSTTAAYIALDNGKDLFSDQPSTSLQRYQTTDQSQLLLVNALHNDAYSSHIASAFFMTLCAGMIATIAIIPLGFHYSLKTWNQSWSAFAKENVGFLYCLVIVLILIPSVVWLCTTSAAHNQAVTDFSSQIIGSIGEAMGIKLESSTSMAKQAERTWYFTGAATTNLLSINSWLTQLMNAFYEGSKLSTIRFGTYRGLEQGANGTAASARVLSRTSSSGCLKTYLSDGTTSDAATYPDDCYYDPRYTDWYVAGRKATLQSEFSNTYGDAWLAAVRKACQGNCSTSFVGVWASEWQISSVGTTLARLKDGFEGSLAVVETTGIVLSTSSGVTLEPAISCSDQYIQKAAAVVAGATSYTWSAASGLVVPDLVVLTSFNIVGTTQMTWDNFPEASGKFVALMSFDQAQLYQRYEEFRTVGLILSVFGIILITILVNKCTQKFEMETQSIAAINDSAFEMFTDCSNDHVVSTMMRRCSSKAQALEEHLSRCPLDYRVWFTPSVQSGRPPYLLCMQLYCHF